MDTFLIRLLTALWSKVNTKYGRITAVLMAATLAIVVYTSGISYQRIIHAGIGGVKEVIIITIRELKGATKEIIREVKNW